MKFTFKKMIQGIQRTERLNAVVFNVYPLNAKQSKNKNFACQNTNEFNNGSSSYFDSISRVRLCAGRCYKELTKHAKCI